MKHHILLSWIVSPAVIVCLNLSGTADAAPAATAPARVLSQCAPDGLQTSGAVYRICTPPAWYYNGDLVIFAHGYIASNEPVGIPEDQLCFDSVCMHELANWLGYGFATTSYSVNGLAVKEGIADILDLIAIYSATQGAPDRVFLVGASQGGLITALMTEQYPQLLSGGLSLCGPIGDFPAHINFSGDFRILFDYFFPNLMPGSVTQTPQWLINYWDIYYQYVIRPALFNPSNVSALVQLIKTARVPFDRQEIGATLETSLRDQLWYSTFGTNDAIAKLGGIPFDNLDRVYVGSNDDTALNAVVERVSADPAALVEMDAFYNTSGALQIPLLTMHTLRDQQVPYWHELLYRQKAQNAGTSGLHTNIPINRYGHCTFTVPELVAAFSILVEEATDDPLRQEALEQLLPGTDVRADFERLVQEFGD